MSDLTDHIAAALAQPSLDCVLEWNLFDDDEIDGDVAIIASQLREALADSGLSDAEIKEGLADLAATGGLLVDQDSTDCTTTITVAGLPAACTVPGTAPISRRSPSPGCRVSRQSTHPD